ncbi:MAG: hypothetical protein FDZ70_00895 [Actinobacteria bacterium]|nr:MAG: hypothetical protein FDZ70_00895 [Actinomycetota bacterium]
MASQECECKEFCFFFERHAGKFGPVEPILKANLCGRGGEECARHVVFALAGPRAVPSELYPNDIAGAMRVVERHRAEAGTMRQAC